MGSLSAARLPPNLFHSISLVVLRSAHPRTALSPCLLRLDRTWFGPASRSKSTIADQDLFRIYKSSERELKKIAKAFRYPRFGTQEAWDFANVLREWWPKPGSKLGHNGAAKTPLEEELAMERRRLIEDLKAMEDLRYTNYVLPKEDSSNIAPPPDSLLPTNVAVVETGVIPGHIYEHESSRQATGPT
ncbi:hypothetical protein HDU93_000683, partial [Gonapodya sp. JEL0774]